MGGEGAPCCAVGKGPGLSHGHDAWPRPPTAPLLFTLSPVQQQALALPGQHRARPCSPRVVVEPHKNHPCDGPLQSPLGEPFLPPSLLRICSTDSGPRTPMRLLHKAGARGWRSSRRGTVAAAVALVLASLG